MLVNLWLSPLEYNIIFTNCFIQHIYNLVIFICIPVYKHQANNLFIALYPNLYLSLIFYSGFDKKKVYNELENILKTLRYTVEDFVGISNI